MWMLWQVTSTVKKIMPVVGPPMGPPPTMGGYPPQFAPHPGGPPPPMGNEQPTQAMMVESAHKRQDFDALCHIINQWNANRLDLFALTLPNEVGHHFHYT